MAVQKQDDHQQLYEDTGCCPEARRWTIGKSGERGSGISVLPARHDDDDDDLHKPSATDKVRHKVNFKRDTAGLN